MYVSTDSTYNTRAEVEAALNAPAVLLGYVTKPGPNSIDTLTITEARSLLQLTGTNWESVKAVLEGSEFTVYVTSTGSSAQGNIHEANLFITFTAKL